MRFLSYFLLAFVVAAGAVFRAPEVSADSFGPETAVLTVGPSHSDRTDVVFVSGRFHDRDGRHHFGKRHFDFGRRDFHSRHFRGHDHRHFGSPKHSRREYFPDRRDHYFYYPDRFRHDRHFRGPGVVFCYRSGSAFICFGG